MKYPYRRNAGGGTSKTTKMIINKTILFIIAMACRVLDIAFSILNIPVSLAHKALDAMSREADSISENIMDEIKRY